MNKLQPKRPGPVTIVGRALHPLGLSVHVHDRESSELVWEVYGGDMVPVVYVEAGLN